jgi:hypothetical protein
MSDQLNQTLEFLRGKVRAKEQELATLRSFVNQLASEAGLPKIYEEVAVVAEGAATSIRPDHFYGQASQTAIRTYLEMRKASGQGPATVADIYAALVKGGYAFETKDENNAKAGVRMVLRKNSGAFHRLPNGTYGLLAWYPNAKTLKKNGGADDDDGAATTSNPDDIEE